MIGEKASKLIRRSTATIKNPMEREHARKLLEHAWAQGNSAERKKLRAMMLRST